MFEVFNKKEVLIIRNDIKLLFTLPIALLLMIIIFSIKKLVLIRFGFVHSDRIGHFAANTELFLCDQIKKKNKVKNIDFFYFPTKPCNFYLALLLKRKLKFYPKFLIRPFCLITRKFIFLKDHVTGQPPMRDYDIFNYYERYQNQIKLSKTEITNGNKILAKLNPKNKPIVLLIVRDSKYLKKKINSNKFSYHNHRDDDIERYKPLVEHIIKKGFFVIRMGKMVKKKLNISNDYFLDYPFSKIKSDFMDIFLGYKCFLCISNVTGYDAVPTIFRKPILFFGSIPIGFMSTSSKKFINTTYNHFSLKLKKNLNLKEIFSNGLDDKFRANDFKNKKIILKKTNYKSMIKIFDETISYIQRDYNFDKSTKVLQLIFKNNYMKYLKKFSPHSSFLCHGKIRSFFPKSWLIENKFLLK